MAAVRDRAPGSSISDALKARYLAEIAAMRTGPQRRILTLMEETPALVPRRRVPAVFPRRMFTAGVALLTTVFSSIAITATASSAATCSWTAAPST
ncbi:hypothetical protein AB0C27_54410 [Nonomuraea sp. NPDC048882]|uniref:hypothetical protein n=1 Tax=Nonomuraea sp. NPDC048882 TaxID=3154347 RepID=UPI000A634BEF